MDEDTYSISLTESSDASDQLEEGGELNLTKVPFLVPGEGYVVGYGTRYLSKTFGGGPSAVELKFYDANNHLYEHATFFGNINQINIPPPSTTPRGRSAIHYRFLSSNGWSGWMDTGWFHVADPPTLTSPSADNTVYTTGNPVFSGTGDAAYSARVQLRRASDGVALSGWVTVPSNNRWNMTLNSLATGRYEVYLAGTGDYWQVEYHGSTFRFIVLREPQITAPTQNAVVVEQKITISGSGFPGARVHLHHPGGEEFKIDIPVDDYGNWTTTVEGVQQDRELYFVSQQVYGGKTTLHSSPPHKLRLLGPPPLTTHSANQEVEQRITVGGVVTGPFKSGTINVYRDGTTTLLGSGIVLATGGWEASITLTPGPYTVTASHVYQSVTSSRRAPLRLLVRPPKPTITSALNGETVTLSGTGYDGARMDIHFGGVSSPYLDAAVSSGRWSKVLPPDLLPGGRRFGGRQSVSDGGNGRIYNDGWAVEVSVNVPTPVPTGVGVTVNGQRATFKGRGRQWGTSTVRITIYNNGVALVGVPQANVQSNLNWETTANANLAPGNYTALTARQWVNDQWSGDSAVMSMSVGSPAPVFTEPPSDTPTGQRPQISGTAWPGSAILLQIPGKPDVPLTATNGSFVLNASEDWAPATYTLRATAAFGGQTSTAASRTFVVKAPKPVITTAANAEVDLSPVIRGTGFKNCWVVIYSNVTNQPIGAGPVGQDNQWAVTLVEQIPGNLTLYAIQQESQTSSNVSDRTIERTVKVRVPKPVITVPAQNGKPARESMFSGSAKYPGTVELSIKGQSQPILKDIEVKQDGTWAVKVTLAVGGFTLEARSRQMTYLSDPVERVITVVPAIPVLDTPRNGDALGTLLSISGFGYPGDTIRIFRRNRYLHLGNTTVSAEGTWSKRVTHAMMAGDGISVHASAGVGLDSSHSPTISFLLLKLAPKITEPQAGDWVGIRPLFSGLATPGASITVASGVNADDVLAPATIADDSGRWTVTGNKDLPEGAMRVMARQTVDGTPSEWFESGRFMVERKTAGFDAPVVHFPHVGQEVGRWPMFSGTGEPGAEVLIVKENSMSTELGRTRVDRDGRWALRSQIELPVANTTYRYSVRQSRDGAISAWLLPHPGFIVKQVAEAFESPTILKPVNDASQSLERLPLFAGQGVPGAELKVYRHGSSQVLASTRVDAQGNWSVRCEVELSVQTAAHQVSARQFMDGRESVLSSVVSFNVEEKLDKPVFTYPPQNSDVSPHAVIRGTALPGGEVRLYKSGNSSRVWGSGVVDGQGHWEVVTDAMPLGSFSMVARVYMGAAYSQWTTALSLKVSNIG